MNNHKIDQYIYGITDVPPTQTLVLLGLQHLVKFSLLLICPLMILNTAGASQAVIQQVISMSLIASGITTLMIASNYKSITGYFIPVQSSVSYFAILLAAARMGGMPLVFGTTILLGICQCSMCIILRFVKPVLDETTIGFIILMIGIWTALLGVSELFYPVNLGQIIIHETSFQSTMDTTNSLIGCLSLLIMITLRLSGRYRLYSILAGMLTGWFIALLCGQLLPDKLLLLSNSNWFQLPSLTLPHYAFDKQLILPILIISFLTSLEISALINTIKNLENKNWQPASTAQIRKGNLATGIGTILAGLSGTVAQSPIPNSVGDLIITGAYSRYIAYIYGPALIFLAFTPKLYMLTLTVPAAVNGAAIVFMGAAMTMKGFAMLHIETLEAYHLQAFSMAFLLGLGTDVFPDAMPWFANSALAVGLISYLALRYLFAFGRTDESNN